MPDIVVRSWCSVLGRSERGKCKLNADVSIDVLTLAHFVEMAQMSRFFAGICVGISRIGVS